MRHRHSADRRCKVIQLAFGFRASNPCSLRSPRRATCLLRLHIKSGDVSRMEYDPIVICEFGCGEKFPVSGSLSLRCMTAAQGREYFMRASSVVCGDLGACVGAACHHCCCQESVAEIHATTCQKVLLDCPFACGTKDLFRAELPEHMKQLCPRRRMRCPLECINVRVGSVTASHCSGPSVFETMQR